MEMTLIYTIIGFALAGYSVIANDSIQTLGTFIASKKKWFKWYTLAGSASAVMIFALAWGWYASVSYTHLRAHETSQDLVCRLLLEKKNQK